MKWMKIIIDWVQSKGGNRVVGGGGSWRSKVIELAEPMGAGSLCSPSFVLAPFLLLSLRSWNGGTNERRVLKGAPTRSKVTRGIWCFGPTNFWQWKGWKSSILDWDILGFYFYLFIYLFWIGSILGADLVWPIFGVLVDRFRIIQFWKEEIQFWMVTFWFFGWFWVGFQNLVQPIFGVLVDRFQFIQFWREELNFGLSRVWVGFENLVQPIFGFFGWWIFGPTNFRSGRLDFGFWPVFWYFGWVNFWCEIWTFWLTIFLFQPIFQVKWIKMEFECRIYVILVFETG